MLHHSKQTAPLSTFGIRIPLDELQIEASHSSGPGGQTVNKVASKVTLRFKYMDSRSLSEEQKKRLQTSAVIQHRTNGSGEIVISAQEHRSQHRNKEEAIERLHKRLEEALSDRPERRATLPPASAEVGRLREKILRSGRKDNRRALRTSGEPD